MNIWLLTLGVVTLATAIWGVRRRNRGTDRITTEPVSHEWLAEARGREEHSW